MENLIYTDISKMLDHAVLKPQATDDDVREGCAVAVKYNAASICVRPSDLVIAAECIKNSSVLLSTVIGFPHGGDSPVAKLASADDAIRKGAEELDVVLNIGKLISGDRTFVKNELGPLVSYIHGAGKKVKIIFENCYLSEEQKIEAAKICNEIGVDWVKTSTGFGNGGATLEDVALMRKYALPEIQVKASGGIKTLEQLMEFRALGCSRIGTSSTAAIMEAFRSK